MPEGFAFLTDGDPIPFNISVAWKHGAEKLFSVAAKTGAGEGELSVAAAMLNIAITDPTSPTLLSFLDPFISGQRESYDIDINDTNVTKARESDPTNAANWRPHRDHFGRIEVKKPSNGQIKLAAEGTMAVMLGYPFFRDLAIDVGKAISVLDELLELSLPHETYTALKNFASDDVTMIVTGNMSAGRAIGHLAEQHTRLAMTTGTRKWNGQKFGLFQAVTLLHVLKQAKLDLNDRSWVIQIKGTRLSEKTTAFEIVEVLKALKLTDDRMAKQLEKLELNPLQIDMLRHLSNPAFDDPALILRAFERLAPPTEAFSGVDIAALVSPTRVQLVRRNDLDSVMKLLNIVQGGRPCYRFQFNEPLA